MASELYEIKVLKLGKTKITLNVEVVQRESMEIPESPGFALSLLCDNADKDSKLAGLVDSDDVDNQEWAKKNAKAYVKSVKVTLKNKPSDEILADDSNVYWDTKSNWLKGKMEIEVTDPAWIEHMSEDDEWESASFDPSMEYDDCKPNKITKVKTASKDDGQHAGMMPIWKYMADNLLLKSEHEIIWIPKYEVEEYIPVSEKEAQRFSEGMMNEIENKLATVECNGLTVFGVVVKIENSWSLLEVIEDKDKLQDYLGGYSTSMYAPFKLTPIVEGCTITEMMFDTTKRKLPKPFNIDYILSTNNLPVIYEATINDKTLELNIINFSNNMLVIDSKSGDALCLLAAPWINEKNELLDAGNPLSDFINSEFKSADLIPKTERYLFKENEFAMKVQSKVITSFKISQTAKIEFPKRFGALKPEEFMSYFQFDKWPRFKVKIQVTDPKYIAGYDEKVPFSQAIKGIRTRS